MPAGNVVETFKQGLPEGAEFIEARGEIMEPRTWIALGFEGVEIYLDAEESVRFLVRRVRKP
jgi:hypothetical protein